MLKNKLRVTHATLLKSWKQGEIIFDEKSFNLATLLLKNNLLPDNAQFYYAQQIEQAISESLASKAPLSAFFQTQSQPENRTNSAQLLAKKVQVLLDKGFSKQKAIQKIAIEHKTSAFNVNKQYRSYYTS